MRSSFTRGWTGLLASLATVLSTACGDGDAPRNAHLLDGNAKRQLASAEEERLRKLQLLRVIGPDGQRHEIEVKTVFYEDAGGTAKSSSFGQLIFQNCFQSSAFKKEATKNLERVQRLKCFGDMLLGMATNPASITLHLGPTYIDELDQAGTAPTDAQLTEGDYAVLPQSSATNAALAEAATRWYASAIQKARGYLSDGIDGETIDPLGPGIGGSTFAAAQLGAIIVDAFHSGKDAYEVAVKHTLAAAQAATTEPAFSLARQREISSPRLSRMAAAHLLVGGQAGFLGSTTEPFCTAGRMSGPAEAALKVFREAGVAPADILNPQITIRQLVEAENTGSGGAGAADQPTDGSIKARLGDTWGRTLAANQSPFDLYSLAEEDFAAARQHLVEELGIWSRSQSATFPLGPGVNGVLPKYHHYAATATPPQPRNPWYWVALAQTETSGGSNNPEWYSSGNAPDFQGSYASFVASTTDAARRILETLPSGTTQADRDLLADLSNPLLTLRAQTERTGTFKLCNSEHAGEWTFDITVTDVDMSQKLYYVTTEDQMACATTGTIEGAPCAIEVAHKVPMGDIAISVGDIHELEKQGTVVGAVPHTVLNRYHTVLKTGERVYLLTPLVKNNSHGGTGDFKVVFAAPLPRAYSHMCRSVPIVPEAAERVAQIMAPSSAWCGRAQYTCSGGEFDERIPLEDELTNDQDGVESSWKHYLALAKNAAAESDRLGEEYINSSLAVDQRAEELSLRQQQQQEKAAAELEALQDICGTAIDPAILLDKLGRDGSSVLNLSQLDKGPCEGDDDAPALTKCVDGRAVVDWTKVAAAEPLLADLANCIADFTDTVTTTLGDSDVCAWTDADGTLCASEIVDGDGVTQAVDKSIYPCPTIPRGGACPPSPAGATAVTLAKHDDALGFFSTETTLRQDPDVALCDNVRAQRRHPTLQADDAPLKALINSNHFEATELASLRKRIEFEATIGGHFNVKVDNKTAFTSGSADSGTISQNWPCGDNGRANFCEAGDPSLFCMQVDCKDPAQRSAAAERFFRAVAAAQLTSYAGGDDAKVANWIPLYLRHGATPLDGASRTIHWDRTNYNVMAPTMPVPDIAPITLTSSDHWRLYTGNFLDKPIYQFGSTKWFLSESTPDDATDQYRFAINHTVPVGSDTTPQSIKDPPALRAAYWGGLSNGSEGAGDGDTKYFYKLLAGGERKPNNPGAGTIVRYGYNVEVYDTEGDRPLKQYYELSTPSFPQVPDPFNPQLVPFSKNLPFTYNFSDQDGSLLDGLELMCEVAENFGSKANGCSTPPTVSTIDDLSTGGSYLECLGDQLTNLIALAVFKEFPKAALDPLRQGTTSPKGQLGVAVSALRSALLRTASSGPSIARTMRDFGLDMKRLRETFHLYDLGDKVEDVQFNATQFSQVTNCIVTAATQAGRAEDKLTFGTTAAIATAATCANSLAQIGFADQLRNLKQEESQSQRELAIIDFNERFSAHIEALEKQSFELAAAREDILQQLGIINGLHMKARRAVDKALWYLSRQATNEAEISSVLSKRSVTAQKRYERAFENAKRLSFLAGLAIEQRLGVYLKDMTEALPLVDAPSTWAPTVCTSTGINYAKLRDKGDGMGGSGSTNGAPADNFADQYIGDYVTKLENVVESYRLSQNFHEGRDTAVVSLRDDIFNLRKDCEVESPNRLYWASALDRVSIKSTTNTSRVGWALSGCGVGANGAVLKDCIGVSPHSDAPFVDLRPQLRTVPAFNVQFGALGCTNVTCGYRSESTILQKVTLEPGQYRFSWYTHPSDSSAVASGFVRRLGAAEVTRLEGTTVPARQGVWPRPYFIFEVTAATAGDYEVGFKNPSMSQGSVAIAAPMLERVDASGGETSSANPKMFSDTTDKLITVAGVCQDTDGKVFRQKSWTRGCSFLCPDGYSSDCARRAKEACYWETSLHISQREIESGHQFKASGFARGNFNYRVDSIGLNFVGTGLRACEDSETPSACYGGGFIPYSLTHAGPYYVRNRQGLDYEAKLFTGSIEHARGLATERYVTNPLSDSDRSLIERFQRQEFQGRPLDGDFQLRVWEEDGVDFNKIEDVQLVLNYSYWTRFN